MDEALAQYYVAPAGVYSDGALALLVARAALLGEARWGTRADYRRWRTIRMTKIVLEATPDDFALARRAPEALAVATTGREAVADESATVVVLPPGTRADAPPPIGQLHLARKRRGQAPEPIGEPVLVLVAADDLGMHGGKLAAQAAHGALLATEAGRSGPQWADWERAGQPLALRRANSATLAALESLYPAGAVHDAGFTQVASGSLTVVTVPPGTPEAAHLMRDGLPW